MLISRGVFGNCRLESRVGTGFPVPGDQSGACPKWFSLGNFKRHIYSMLNTPDFMFQIGAAGNLKLQMILVLAIVGANCLFNSSPKKESIYHYHLHSLVECRFLKWSMLTAEGCQGSLSPDTSLWGIMSWMDSYPTQWCHPKEWFQSPFKSVASNSMFSKLSHNRKTDNCKTSVGRSQWWNMRRINPHLDSIIWK